MAWIACPFVITSVKEMASAVVTSLLRLDAVQGPALSCVAAQAHLHLESS